MEKVKTYEIFTTKYSKIIQAKNMASAIGKFGLSDDIDQDIIAIIEVERGQEFINGSSNCFISDVSQQRKLLVAYENFKLMTSDKFNCAEQAIDKYLAANSS